MEKIWEELRRIETQAENIRAEAQVNAGKITKLAQQEAEQLLENGKAYAEEEAQLLYGKAVEEANRDREQNLKDNQEAAEKLRRLAETRIERAALAVENAVLGVTER